MKKIVLIFTVLLSCYVTANEECSSTTVAASYHIKETTKANTKENELVLLRTEKSVFHISDQKLATQWTKLPNDRIKKTSYFIDDKQAIEYEPTAKANNTWQYHAQLLHPLFKTQSTLIETAGLGCDKVEHFQQKSDTKKLDIWWYPEKKLAKRIESKFGNKTVILQLINIDNNKKIIQQQINHLTNFQSTDYADIGDNESDPFFRKMINLGFIEHSGSGFYDSEGHSLSSAHQH